MRDMRERLLGKYGAFGALKFLGAMTLAAGIATAGWQESTAAPLTPASPAPIGGPLVPVALGEDRSEAVFRTRRMTLLVQRIQVRLAELGIYEGPIEGEMNAETARAIRAYQRLANLPVDGTPTNALLSHLNSAAGSAHRLLQRLDDVRQDQIEAARAALEEVFGPAGDDSGTRPPPDSETCYAAPTTGCLLQLAQEVAGGIEREDLRDWALSTIVQAFARTGDLAAAMNAARSIDDPRSALTAISAVTVVLAAEDRGDEAIELAERFPGPRLRNKAWRAVASAEALEGNIRQALRTARAIDVPRERLEALIAIARAAALHGKTGKAMVIAGQASEVAAEIDAAVLQDWARNELAALYAELGDLASARATAGEIHAAAGRVHVLCTIVTTGLSSLDRGAAEDLLEEASLLARTIPRRAERQQARGRLAAAHAALGEFETAQRHAAEIELGFTHAYAISRIAVAMGGTDDYREAIKLAQSIGDERLRVDALLTISRARTELGDSRGAARAGEAVEESVARIRSSMDRASVLADLAVAEAIAGGDGRPLFIRALEELRSMTDPWSRARMLAKAATTLFVLGASPPGVE